MAKKKPAVSKPVAVEKTDPSKMSVADMLAAVRGKPIEKGIITAKKKTKKKAAKKKVAKNRATKKKAPAAVKKSTVKAFDGIRAEDCVKRTKNWKQAVVERTWVDWRDDEGDNHGMNILYGPFASEEAAEVWMAVQDDPNMEVLSWHDDWFRGEGIEFVAKVPYQFRFGASKNYGLFAPPGWLGDGEFKLNCVENIPIIDLDAAKRAQWPY